MRPRSTQVVFLAAAGVLMVGGVCASQLFTARPKYTGPSTGQILAMSQRLQVEAPEPPSLEALSVHTRAAVEAASKRREFVAPNSRQVRQDAGVETAIAAKTPAPPQLPKLPTAAEAKAPPAAPGSDLALTGIAGSGSAREAMVFNLADRTRESGKAGDTVFGFTLTAIHDDSVDMTQGSTELTLRLGEKSAAVEAALASPVPGAAAVNPAAFNPDSANAAGNGMNPFGGNGGRGGEWRARMAAAAQASFSGGGGVRNGGGGGNSGRRNATTLSGARRYSNEPGSSSRYSTVSTGTATQNNRFGGFGFGGFGGRGGQGMQQQADVTSNPQEARRTGARLMGDAEGMDEPEALTNPQTERRTGSATGQAFGNNNYFQNGYGGAGNRGGNSRTGVNGSGGFGNTGRAAGGAGTRTGTTRG